VDRPFEIRPVSGLVGRIEPRHPHLEGPGVDQDDVVIAHRLTDVRDNALGLQGEGGIGLGGRQLRVTQAVAAVAEATGHVRAWKNINVRRTRERRRPPRGARP
jgi:hypothetical protein